MLLTNFAQNITMQFGGNLVRRCVFCPNNKKHSYDDNVENDVVDNDDDQDDDKFYDDNADYLDV